MWDDDDEYFDRAPMPEATVHQAIAVVLGVALVLVAVFW